MKKVIGLFLLLICIAILPGQLIAEALEAFEIDNYQVDVEVYDDNSYDITEKIEVTFSAERHGIFRTIPSRYNDQAISVRDIKVADHQYSISKTWDNVEIKIGSPDVKVQGQQSYTISYHYIIGKDGISDYDEFYYNLIGTEWDTYIHNASFTIKMPKEFDQQKVNITSGYYNSIETNNVNFSVTGNVISGNIIKPLKPNQGVTIALPLPEGYYHNAKEVGTVSKIIRILMYLVTGLFLAISLRLWYKHGRDRKLVAPIEFYPPYNMTSAEMGYIIDGIIDNRDITSLILLWASRGYLKIVEPEESDSFFGKLSQKLSKKTFTLMKCKEADHQMNSFEQDMFNSMFNEYGNGKTVTSEDLHNKFYSTISSTKTKIKLHFKHKSRLLYTPKSIRLRYLTHILSFVPCMVILFATFFNIMGALAETIALSIIASLILGLPIFGLMSLLMYKQDLKPGLKLAPIVSVLIAPIPSALLAYFFLQPVGFSLVDVIVLVLTGVALNMIAFVMPQRTEYANKRIEQILGFRDFLVHAEKPRLEALVAENPEYFYETMAYALVLGVSDKWANKFDSITIEPPNWYEGYHYTTFRTASFSRHLSKRFNSMHQSMVSSPSSKGGGGSSSFSGGSVGGGSGGGGGGSW